MIPFTIIKSAILTKVKYSCRVCDTSRLWNLQSGKEKSIPAIPVDLVMLDQLQYITTCLVLVTISHCVRNSSYSFTANCRLNTSLVISQSVVDVRVSKIVITKIQSKYHSRSKLSQYQNIKNTKNLKPHSSISLISHIV